MAISEPASEVSPLFPPTTSTPLVSLVGMRVSGPVASGSNLPLPQHEELRPPPARSSPFVGFGLGSFGSFANIGSEFPLKEQDVGIFLESQLRCLGAESHLDLCSRSSGTGGNGNRNGSHKFDGDASEAASDHPLELPKA